MTTQEMFSLMDSLKPQGSREVVRLFLGDAAYFNYDFVKECVNDFKKAVQAGTEVSPLQKLGIQVLLESSNYRRYEAEHVIISESAN